MKKWACLKYLYLLLHLKLLKRWNFKSTATPGLFWICRAFIFSLSLVVTGLEHGICSKKRCFYVIKIWIENKFRGNKWSMSVKTKAPPPDTVQGIISVPFGLCDQLSRLFLHFFRVFWPDFWWKSPRIRVFFQENLSFSKCTKNLLNRCVIAHVILTLTLKS